MTDSTSPSSDDAANFAAEALRAAQQAVSSLGDQSSGAGSVSRDAGDAAADALRAAQEAIAAAKDLADPGSGARGGMGAGAMGGGAGGAGMAGGAGATIGGPKPFALPNLNQQPMTQRPEGIDLLSDVNLNVKIELGRTRMIVEDVLRLGEGSVVELDKLAGDPVDIYVNDRHVARGEVLVLNDNFCVRINEIVAAIGEGTESRISQ